MKAKLKQKELHKRILEAWQNMPDGSKKRLELLGHSRQMTAHILKTPNFAVISKMESLLLAMKQASKDIKNKVVKQDKKVQKA
jgi:hypothetical protein